MNSFLLVQFRTDKSALQEKKCFLPYFRKKELKIINAFDREFNFSRPQKIIKEQKGIILAGSGQFSFSKHKKEKFFQEFLKRISPLIKYILKEGFPALGICFGHQILGHFLGVKVINDVSQAGTGSFPVFLTRKRKNSHIFSKIPLKFTAQFGHIDSLEKLPKKTALLAKSARCKITAFSFKKNIYGVQFHPELNKKEMMQRLKFYPQYCSGGLKNLKKILKPSPYASKIIENFIRICLAK